MSQSDRDQKKVAFPRLPKPYRTRSASGRRIARQGSPRVRTAMSLRRDGNRSPPDLYGSQVARGRVANRQLGGSDMRRLTLAVATLALALAALATPAFA